MTVESGEVWWAELSPAQGREQRDRRPVVVIANDEYLDAVTELVVVLPGTSVDRNWPNHVRLQGDLALGKPTFAMTEQPRTISRSRLKDRAGQVSPDCLDEIAQWVDDWLVHGSDHLR